MLHYTPKDFKALAIDPGTDTVGIAVLVAGPGGIRLEQAFTFNAANVIKNDAHYQSIAQIYGPRMARIAAIGVFYQRFLFEVNPSIIFVETPYLGRFADAFASLVQVFMQLNISTMEWHPRMGIIGIDPSSAKVSVGVTERGSNKDLVEAGVKRLFPDAKQIFDVLDEHAFDAVAVGYCGLEGMVPHVTATVKK